MIDFIKQTPDIYSSSRDFQVLARLYTILFNSCRAYIDGLDNLTGNHLDNLSELEVRNRNFIPKRAWDNETLAAASECFNYIMRAKGTKTAIEQCIYLLLRMNNLSADNMVITTKEIFDYCYNNLDWSNFTSDRYTSSNYYYIIIPKSLSTVGVIQDLLDYVLPIGVSYRVIEFTNVQNVFKTKLITKSPDGRVRGFNKTDKLKQIPIKPYKEYNEPPKGHILFNEVVKNANVDQGE